MTAHLYSTTVSAPARLHLGFLDLHGGLGRRFGSLGLALDEVATTVTAQTADRICAEGPQARRAETYARLALRHMGIATGAHIVVHRAIPEHAGLGSGTQLALAVASALAHLYGAECDARALAATLNRGQRSGIGLGLFEQGGFVLDGGRGATEEPPRITARLDFPASWRLLLILDDGFRGLHGAAEKEAFAALPMFSEQQAGRLCRLALMQALPALAEHDIAGFGAAISAIQAAVGDHFAPAQGGRFASRRVARALDWCAHNGASGVGQSSWGPTGFVLLDSETRAHALLRALRSAFADQGLEFLVCSGRNRGADLSVERIPARASAT
ncbi:beta-ribofuranosylaminobenzene 5'-phosphate synthase family protein [Parasulfuritortus cantonensis]|nr:beta-ribofuranosylaminobenzene 5'-phosphate synthase family protein [Parasulfuritortus cantonensis]